MHRIVLSDTGAVIHPQRQSVQELVRASVDAGQREIRIDLANVPSPTSDVLIALSLAARQATELHASLVVANANQRVRVAITQLGIAALGVSFAEDKAGAAAARKP